MTSFDYSNSNLILNNDLENNKNIQRSDSFDFSLCHDYCGCYYGYWH